jgi:menaquinone-dependent protoporphyrinogen oxidase
MKALVVAASKHGASFEIAERIGSKLEERGIETVVADPGDIDSLEGIGAVVLGSAVYAGHWLAPAKDFVDRFDAVLATIPVWIFSSGPIGDPPKPEEDPVDVAEMQRRTDAVEHRLFAGRLDKSKLGFAERAIVAALRAPVGDFRDWDEIAAWTGAIAAALVGATSATDD